MNDISSYDFSSILENTLTASWMVEPNESHIQSVQSDNRIKEDRTERIMSTPQAARNFLVKLGLLSGTPELHKTSSAQYTDDRKGLLEPFHGHGQTMEASEITCRDDQTALSFQGLSIGSYGNYEEPKILATFHRSFSDKFRVTLSAVLEGNWDFVLTAIDCDPELLVMRSNKQNQTLLHAVVSQNQFVPEKVVMRMLAINPRIIYALDSNHDTVLHSAAIHGVHTDLLPILLEHWKDGASQPNVHGNLPLHNAASGGKRAEINALVLMGIFPQAAGFLNLEGSLPLHLACSIDDASHITVFKLLEIHRLMNIPIDLRDHQGYSPYQRALSSFVSHQIISAFDLYQNERGLSKGSEEFKTLSEERCGSDFCSVSHDDLREHCTSFINLLEKLPICLGAVSDDGFTKVIYRRSSRLWWLLASDSTGIYFDTVRKILSETTTFSETIALGLVNGPDGEQSLFDVAPVNVVNIILESLLLCDAYQLLLKHPEKSEGLLLYKAVLKGKENRLKSSCDSVSTNGEDAPSELHNKDVVIHCTQVNSDRDKSILREIEIRQTVSIPGDVFQGVVNHHLIDGRKLGCPGHLVRLVVLQRPYMTLANVLEKHRFRKRKNNGWLRKCRNVLRQVVLNLQRLHKSGYIHSCLAPEFIGKFNENEWKLMMVGGIRRIGEIMDCELRSCMPPESIIISPIPTVMSPKTVTVSFSEDVERPRRNIDNLTCCSSHDGTENQTDPFVCSPPMADESWDTWGLGLIMGQLLLGPSAVLLPNFDRNPNSYMSRIFQFKHQSLQAIKHSMAKHAGENAADLVGRLLEPTPEKRLKNMTEILLHGYFHDEIGHHTN